MLTVVIVDDDDIVFCMEMILAREGYRTEGYTTVVDFLASYTPKPGCILLNGLLFGMSVFDVLREMRERQWTVPVVTTRCLGVPPSRKVYPYWAGHIDLVSVDGMLEAVRAVIGRK